MTTKIAPTAKPKVLCFGYPTHCGQEFLDNFLSKFDLQTTEPGTREETKRNLAEKVKKDGPFDALIVPMGTPLYEPFDEDLLGPLCPQVKIVSSVSAGYNDFDVEWMTSQNVIFCNSRNAVCEPTADMAILMILAVLRNVKTLENTMKQGLWRGTLGEHAPTDDPNGKTLGLIGLGAIGKHVARKAQVFNLNVKYYQRTRLSPAEEENLGVTYCSSMNELLECSDIISPHFPLHAGTKGLIGRAEFARMKDGVFFINTARGAIVDEEALIEALESGKVARCGLDVHCVEPNHDTYFTRSNRCFVQPHMGGLTKVAWFKAFQEAMNNIEQFFASGKAISPINENEVNLNLSKS